LASRVLSVCLPPAHATTLGFSRLFGEATPPLKRALVEILDLRHFSSIDLRPLLEDETQIWEKMLSWDYTGSADMILRYVDAKILPGYAAIEHGRIFGYAFFVYEGSKGVIGDLFVANGGRLPNPREVESRLLVHVIETLQQSPGIHRVEAQLLLHETGVVSRPFTEQGFHRHARVFMVLPLTGATKPDLTVKPEVEIRPWTEQDYQPAAAVITSAYRGHVDSEINDQYRTLPRMRDLRLRLFFRRPPQAQPKPDRADSLFASAPRCWPCHSGLRAAGISRLWCRQGFAGCGQHESHPAKLFDAVTDRD